MSPYRIELRPAAIRALKQVQPEDRERIQDGIALLGHDPRPPKANALSGRPGYRVRVGDYRIIYAIQNDVLLVLVVNVGHRRDICQMLKSPSDSMRMVSWNCAMG